MDQTAGAQTPWQAIVGKFYEGSLDPVQWDEGLAALARSTASRGAVFTSEDSATRRSRVLHHAGQSDEAVRAYDEEFYRIAPLMQSASSVQQGVWHDWMRRNPGHRRSAYYNEFLLPHGNHASIVSVVWKKGDRFAAVGLQRSCDQGEFDGDDERLLAPLMPHIMRAVRIYFATRELRSLASLRKAALDELAAPVFVVDAAARVLLCNAAAEQLCRDGGGLVARGGRLCAEVEPECLQGAIACAAAARHATGSFLRLRVRGSDDTLLSVVAPLSASSARCADWQQPAAVVMASRDTQDGSSLATGLRAMYGVTAAEARLAHSFAQGLSVAEIAADFELRLETVRTQLKSLFGKLGVRRQAELSRMLAGMQVLLPRQASSCDAGDREAVTQKWGMP